MSDSSKEVSYHEDGFIVIRDTSVDIPPISCDVCSFFIKTAADTESWKEYKCCRECAVTWAEGLNKKKWIEEGWRPSKKVIQREVEKRTKIVSRLKL
jgi:hypothetical protein